MEQNELTRCLSLLTLLRESPNQVLENPVPAEDGGLDQPSPCYWRCNSSVETPDSGIAQDIREHLKRRDSLHAGLHPTRRTPSGKRAKAVGCPEGSKDAPISTHACRHEACIYAMRLEPFPTLSAQAHETAGRAGTIKKNAAAVTSARHVCIWLRPYLASHPSSLARHEKIVEWPIMSASVRRQDQGQAIRERRYRWGGNRIEASASLLQRGRMDFRRQKPRGMNIL